MLKAYFLRKTVEQTPYCYIISIYIKEYYSIGTKGSKIPKSKRNKSAKLKRL
jgi:hypothetical protein